jgi:hypothetical protein
MLRILCSTSSTAEKVKPSKVGMSSDNCELIRDVIGPIINLPCPV